MVTICIIIETINENDKPREDPSDWFNFGFDEEKWIKFLNKSILAHYERHLIQQQANESRIVPGMINPLQPYPTMTMPIRPMPGVLPHPGFMYRWPYPPMMPPSMPNPTEETKNK